MGAASAATVRQYALEGEREVAFIPKESFPAQPSTAPQPADVEVVGRIYFHIRGRQPNAVTLYLKASEFSALHYTEMGTHTHSLSVTGTTQESDPALDEIRTSHFHGSSVMSAVDNDRSKHSTHSLSARKGYIGDHEKDSSGQLTADIAAFFLIERNWGLKFYLPQNTNDFFTNAGAWIADAFTAATHTEPTRAPELDTSHEDILLPTGGVIGEGNHSHDIGGNTDGKGIDLRHKHPISGSGTSGETGVANPLNPASTKARGGTPLTYVSGLQIAINGLDRTTAIQDQIVDSVPGAQKPAWQLGLGNGASNHPLANEAFDAISIRLDFLPHVTFAEGQHVIELSVPRILDGNGNPVPNGGRIHYNLYIE